MIALEAQSNEGSLEEMRLEYRRQQSQVSHHLSLVRRMDRTPVQSVPMILRKEGVLGSIISIDSKLLLRMCVGDQVVGG